MTNFPWYKRDARAFYEGTRRLTLEERGAYTDILDLMYIRGGPLHDDERWMVHALGVSHRKWRRLREALIDAGKIKIEGEFITNERVEFELQARSKRSETNRKNALRSADDRRIKRVSKSYLKPENSENPNEINETAEQIAPHARKSKIKELEIEEGTNVPSSLELSLEPTPEPKKPKSDRQPIVEAFNEYQDTAQRCGLPQARSLTPAMRKSIGARLREYKIEGWRDCLANIERSAFLCGQSETNFRVSLPWMIKPTNFEKIVSGVYGNGRHAEQDEADDEFVRKMLEGEAINA